MISIELDQAIWCIDGQNEDGSVDILIQREDRVMATIHLSHGLASDLYETLREVLG